VKGVIISVESEEGVGTTFKVMLPVVERERALVSMIR
jgi:signal transduction histidine kinase